MCKKKLIRVTTVPLSLEKLLEGQLSFMQQFYEVIAVSSEADRLKQYGENEGVATFRLHQTRKITPFQDLKAVVTLYRFLRKEKPLIVHTHTPKAGIVGMFAAWLARVPLRLHTVAGLPLLEASGIKRKVLNTVEKLTYKLATNVYPNSQGLYDIILAERFTKEKKLKVLGQGSSNGIDTQYFSPEHFSEAELLQKKQQLNIPQSDLVFVFVGRIVSDKGINELVTAFTKLQQKFQDCSLLLVGPFENDLDPVSTGTQELIDQNKKIILTGYQSDVRLYYALANVLVFPSYREGFPNVVMQAGAMELPSIVTNINGCNEIIAHKENGLIVPPKDGEALYHSMDLITTDNTLRKRMAANARPRIVKRYDRQTMWQAILEEYKSLETNL
ncbi:MAG: glycosyltransferase family 4 protein [Flavobacteriales bacterium]|jgi:glycosyltransferase involved in cell wall biosynthesis|nr:glycosyltransferase family 4 protein [Flavobacteriales bacterium]